MRCRPPLKVPETLTPGAVLLVWSRSYRPDTQPSLVNNARADDLCIADLDVDSEPVVVLPVVGSAVPLPLFVTLLFFILKTGSQRVLLAQSEIETWA